MPNELARSSSPYLLQHAHNPVHWRLWSDRAFADARARDVPVLLSIGYATCYWCHVMERESFENDTIAHQMNDHFVCIKLDREEHPEIDEIYMAATTISTGSGGWPMTVFLEPQSRRPFHCGTYYPPAPAYGRPSFPQLLSAMSSAWNDQRNDVLSQAEAFASAVREQVETPATPVRLGEDQIRAAVQGLLTRLDKANFGFGSAPKFPQPVFLDLLLDARPIVDDDTRAALDHAIRGTLDAMALGGLHDQIGGGFHRYSVDAHWTVPHFEKMLYDNAQLLQTYARAATEYNDDFYKRITRRTFEYLQREMAQSSGGGGGYASAQDAEVNHREGQNYLWTPDQIRDVLPDDDANFVIRMYGLDASANFQDPHHPDEPATWVPRLNDRPSEQELARLDDLNTTLLEARSKRDQPALDDKIITNWNALTVSALVSASIALDDPTLLDRAKHTLAFLLESMRTDSGELARATRAGSTPTIPATLEDHAALLAAIADVHRAAPAPELEAALAQTLQALDIHFATAPGVYHDTQADRSDLFVRPRTLHDGATPSGLGLLTLTLARLAQDNPTETTITRAADALSAASSACAQSPLTTTNATRALLTLMRLGPAAAAHYTFETPAAATPRERAPISVFVSNDTITLDDDHPVASIKVALDIAAPYHVVAADPGDSEPARALIPLRVGLISGSGVKVFADYPKGDPHGVEAIGTINAHTGRIEFDIALELAPNVGPTPGPPVLGITYQACADTHCTAPRTAPLGVEITLTSADP